MSITEGTQPAAKTWTVGWTGGQTTTSFTPESGALLVALVSADSSPTNAGTTGSVTDSLSGTWTLLKRQNAQNGTVGGIVEVWCRDSPGAALTVTATGSASTANGGQLVVRTLIGAAPAAQQNGATGGALLDVGTVQLSVAAGTGNMIYGGAFNWTSAAAMTVLANTTSINAFADATNGDNWAAFKSSGDTAGTATYGYSTSTQGQIAAAEIKAAAPGGTPTAVPAQPGRTWRRQFKHRQTRLPDTSIFTPATLTSTLDLISGNGTAPTTANSNISVAANNAAPTMFASTDIGPPHAGTTVTKYTMSVATSALVAWDTVKWTAIPSGLTVYNRFYLYLSALPGATVGLTVMMDGALAASSSVRLQPGGQIQAFATTSVSLGAMSTAIPVGRWVRVETKTFMNATVGNITINLFLLPESTVADEVFVSSNGNTLNAQTVIQRVGLGNIGAGTTATHYFADAAWSNVNYLGPIGGPPPWYPAVRFGHRATVSLRLLHRAAPTVVQPQDLTPTNPAITQLTPGRAAKVARTARRDTTTGPPLDQSVPVPGVAGRARRPLRRRPVVAVAVPGQQAAPVNPPIAQTVTRALRRWGLRRAGHPVNVVPGQQAAPVNPSITQLTVGRLRLTGRINRRAQVATPVAPQGTVPWVQPRRGLYRFRRRPQAVAPVPAQQAAPTNPPITQLGSLWAKRWGLRRYGRVANPTPAQQAAPVNPAITALTAVRARVGARALRRGKVANPTPAQQATATAPPLTQLTAVRGRAVVHGAPRRTQAAAPPIPQATPPTVTTERRGLLRVRRARPRVAVQPPPQAVPPIQVEHRPLRLRRMLRRLGFPIQGGTAPASTAVSAIGSLGGTATDLGSVSGSDGTGAGSGSAGFGGVTGSDETGQTGGSGMTGSAQ